MSAPNQAKQWTPQPVTLFVPKSPPSCSATVSGVRAIMNIDHPTDLEREHLAFFAPASAGQVQLLEDSFPNIGINEYIEIIRKSNGIGEVYADGSERFVHNTIICNADDAIDYSKEIFDNKCLVIGWPGTDGIKFVLKSKSIDVFAYYPIDDEFVKVSDTISDLLKKWLSNEIEL